MAAGTTARLLVWIISAAQSLRALCKDLEVWIITFLGHPTANPIPQNMKYLTKISRHQVVQAFDCWMKRRAAISGKYPYPNYLRTLRHRPQLTKKPLSPKLTMKAIAQECDLSYSTLARLTDTDFRKSGFKRPRIVSFAKRHYRS